MFRTTSSAWRLALQQSIARRLSTTTSSSATACQFRQISSMSRVANVERSCTAFANVVLGAPPTRQWHATAALQSDMPMTRQFIEDRVMLVLRLFDKVDAEKITVDSDLQKDLGLDSLDHVEIIMSMEEEFFFEIPDMDADRLRSPRDIVQYVCDRQEVYD